MLRVLLVHYGEPAWCEGACASLLAAGAGPILVVHNGGPLPVLPAGAELWESPGNLGFTGGVNVGLRSWLEDGTEEWLLVGAHDLHVASDAVRILLAAAQAASEYGVLTFAMDSGTARSDVIATHDRIDEHAWVSGAAMLLRREAVLEVGLLDEDYKFYAEDVEYCLRMRHAGWRVGVVREARARTLGSGIGTRRALAMAFGNHVLMELKMGRPRAAGRRVLLLVRDGAVALWQGNLLMFRARMTGAGIGILRTVVWVSRGRPRPHVWNRAARGTPASPAQE